MKLINLLLLCEVLVLLFCLDVECKKKKQGRGKCGKADKAGRKGKVLNVKAPDSGLRVRLSRIGSSNNSGLIEVYARGKWGVVCDDGWDYRDANVACKQMGFNGGAVKALSGSYFGSGKWQRRDILMSRVSCNGQEQNLASCPHTTKQRCTTSDLASVVCQENNGCDPGWIAGSEGCYLLLNRTRNASKSKRKCAENGGYLSSVETKTENDFLTIVLHSMFPDIQTWLVGGRRKKTKWYWEKSVPLQKYPKGKSNRQKKKKNLKTESIIKEMLYTNFFQGWMPGKYSKEPSKKKKEYCVGLTKSFKHPNGSRVEVGYYFFDDIKCFVKKGEPLNFICEKPLQKNNETIEVLQPDECYTGNGETYRGTMSVTELGTTCQKWTKSLGINPQTHPNKGLGDHNMCRNPDGSLRPWCWVDVERNKFSYCPVPKCPEHDITTQNTPETECYTGTGTTYRGNITETIKGFTCQPWTASVRVNPITHPGKGLGNHNFCRNPDNDARPWCWVRPLTSEFDYCVVKKCRTPTTTTVTTTTTPPPPKCASDQFFCSRSPNSDQCIPGLFHCDNEIDCENGEDETNCDYKLPLFEVTKNTLITRDANELYERIPIELCARYCVESTDFVCRSFGYLTGGRECFLSDMNSNSPGANVEFSSRYHLYELKSQLIGCSGKFQCNNGRCVESNMTCNGHDDCGDLSDEQNCVSQTEPPLQIRLVDGDNEYSGRVELYYYGEWGVVCDDEWDIKDADVACRMLGYDFGARKAVTLSQFGSGNGNFLMDDVKCIGNETSLESCNRKPWKSHNCKVYEVAGVICHPSKGCTSDEFKCQGKKCVVVTEVCNGVNDCGDNSDERNCDVKVQLSDGVNTHSGRVEIVRNGILGTVCRDGWTDLGATVVCRMLGFRFGGQAKSFSPGTGVIWLDDVECRGNESSIADCPHRPWGDHNCGHHEDAGVVCRTQDPCLEQSPCDNGSVCISSEISATGYECCEYSPSRGIYVTTDGRVCSTGGLTTQSPTTALPTTTIDLVVELVDGGQPHKGRVEIIYNGVRGTVCNDRFDARDANVTCRMLGFRSGLPTMQFGQGRGEIWLDELKCTGSEATLLQCPHAGWAIHDCDHTEDVGVICEALPTPALTVSVSLRNGRGRYEGRVEITRGNVTGTVCDDSFTDVDARVVCRMLGYVDGEVAREGMFGLGLDPILLDEVDCVGTEDSIADCDHSGWGVHNCDHTEDVGVICAVPTTSSPTVTKASGGQGQRTIRLVNDLDSRPARGRVEITIDGVTGTVCDDAWDDRDATVVCRQLGFIGGVAVGSARYGEGRGRIFMDDVACRGTEASLFQCRYPGLGAHNCEHSEDAAVICQTNQSVPFTENSQLQDDCGRRPMEALINARRKRDLEQRQVAEYMKPLRILGGMNADYGMYPWQVGVRKVLYRSRWRVVSSQWCGGTILSDVWILSAAHCFAGLAKSAILLRTGDLNNEVDETYEQEFEVDQMLLHEEYDDSTYNNDIALLKIKKQNGKGIVFNNHVQPACLPSETTPYSLDYECHISGWGKTSLGAPDVLKKAEVPIIDPSICKRIYKGGIDDSMFCAGFLKGGVDSCQGDSGGPFVCKVQGRYTVLGVTSWGHGCGKPNSPGVYSHVRNQLSWIINKLNNNS